MTSEREPPVPIGEPRRGPRHAPRPIRFKVGAQEFHKTGVSGFDPRDPYYFAVSISWSRFFLLFLTVELAINVLFALLYTLQPGAIANQPTPGLISAFFFSLETLATVGYGEMYPATLYAHIVSAIEILTGVIFMAIMTGLLFVRFSKAKARIMFAAHPIVTRYNGKPTFMLRIGNARSNVVHDAVVSLYTTVLTISEEGQQHFNIVRVALQRDRLPIFALHWTIMHVLDETSPLTALFQDIAGNQDHRIFLTVSARDPLIGQEVSDVHTFTGADIRFGMRYVDAIQRGADNRVVADYTLLSAIEPDLAAEPARVSPDA